MSSSNLNWVMTSESSQSSDDNRILYMFVRRDDGRYILYKFDTPLFVEKSESSFEMSPLVVFKEGVLPDCLCSFAYIDPYLYIVGAKKEDVFSIHKNVLFCLKHSERERGANFVIPTQPMKADKNMSLAFSYQDNLYVISMFTCPMSPPSSSVVNETYEFEVYSPCTKTWRDLGNTPLSRWCFPVYVHSHLVIGTMVYFTTSLDVVMSFDLNDEMWTTVFDPYGVLAVTFHYVPPLPTFKSQTLVFGNQIFGLSKYRGNGYCDICASSSLNPYEDSFLRPNLAPDEQFLTDVINVPTDLDLSNWSQFIFSLDQDILCVVSYGTDMMTDAYGLLNYAELSFFKISGDSYQHPINIYTCLPSPGCSDGRDVNYFKAEFCSRTRLFIKTKRQFTNGVPCTCIFVDH